MLDVNDIFLRNEEDGGGVYVKNETVSTLQRRCIPPRGSLADEHEEGSR